MSSSAEIMTKNRLLGEKRVYLNNSNSKWISIGTAVPVNPLNDDTFHLEILLSGNDNKHLSLGGLSGIICMLIFVNFYYYYSFIYQSYHFIPGLKLLYKTIRSMPQYGKMYVGNQTIYESGESSTPLLNVSVTGKNGNILQVYSMLAPDKPIFIAGPTITSILQHERAIFSLAMNNNHEEIADDFKRILKSAVTDFNAEYNRIIEAGDELGIELLTNLSDYFENRVDLARRSCIEPNAQSSKGSDHQDAVAEEEEDPNRNVRKSKKQK